jgi:hypothetical protein
MSIENLQTAHQEYGETACVHPMRDPNEQTVPVNQFPSGPRPAHRKLLLGYFRRHDFLKNALFFPP